MKLRREYTGIQGDKFSSEKGHRVQTKYAPRRQVQFRRKYGKDDNHLEERIFGTWEGKNCLPLHV